MKAISDFATAHKLFSFYIVKRSTGVSYTVHSTVAGLSGTIYLEVTPNRTDDPNRFINVGRLIKGLVERRYRLVPRTI